MGRHKGSKNKITTIKTDIFESETITIEESVTTINNEEEIIMLDYSEAKTLIGSQTVKDIHNLFILYQVLQ